MAPNIDRTLRTALKELHAEKGRIDRQIRAIEAALDGVAPTTRRAGQSRRRRARKEMSAAARKAVSARMKAYWAKRRGQKK
jgi:hypothetical protein